MSDDTESALVDLKNRFDDCYVLLTGNFNVYTKYKNDFIDADDNHDMFQDVSQDNIDTIMYLISDILKPIIVQTITGIDFWICVKLVLC